MRRDEMKLKEIAKNRRSYSDKIFDILNVLIMLILILVFAWPLLFVVSASFSDPNAVNAGQVLLFPKGITTVGYELILAYKQLWVGYGNTIFYTVVGTCINMIMSVCLAYPLSDKSFMPRKILLAFFMFTMYFSGGLIPGYLLFKRLGILNTRLAMIVPGMVSVYNSLIIRSYFMNSIPKELKEAAYLDGANSAQYLVKVVLPLSKAVFAVVGLYYMVSHWNNFTNALYYVYDTSLYPLQNILRDLLMSSRLTADLLENPEAYEIAYKQTLLMKYCVIIAATVPMLCVYPFIQKYFVKGVMVGSVKG